MSFTDTCLAQFSKEIASVRKAPFTFVIAVAVTGLFVGGSLYWVFNWEMWNVLEMRNARITELIERLAGSPKANTEEKVNDLALFLQFSDDHTEPKEIRQTNVKYWRSVNSEGYHLDQKEKNGKSKTILSVPYRWWIFIVFNKPVQYRQMFAKCPISDRFQCSLGYHNSEIAIIWLAGDVSQATLEVSVTQ